MNAKLAAGGDPQVPLTLEEYKQKEWDAWHQPGKDRTETKAQFNFDKLLTQNLEKATRVPTNNTQNAGPVLTLCTPVSGLGLVQEMAAV